MFVRMTRSTTHLDDDLDVFVLVVVSRKSKTNLTNKLSHQFLARHRDWRLCGMGHVFLWLHFIYDLVPLRYGPGIVEPLDFSEPLKWTKTHLFFCLNQKKDKGKQKQDEMHYKTHCTWIKWAIDKAKWILSKVTHAFRRSGAQQLHDDGCSDNDIATLGGWEVGEMRRSYVFGIPFKPVWLLAGFSGDRGDYYIGRARAKLPRHKDKVKDEWLQLLDLMRQNIFPWVEEGWKKVRARKLREERDAEREDKARVIAEFEAYKRSVEARKAAADNPAEVDGSSKGTGTVAAAWKLWVQSIYVMGGKSVSDVFVEFDRDPNKNNSFFTAYARFAPKGVPQMSESGCERKMRHVQLVMEAVETFREDSSEAATAAAVNQLDDVRLLCNFTEFTNGLAVLRETPANKKQKTGSSTEKKTGNDVAQRRVSWLIVKMGLRDEAWGTALFGDDEWGVINKEELAKEKAEEEKKRAAEAKKAEREKAKAAASKR
ncbi:unnamed protein product [Closterium sp. Naga37s-1]|nr:unnamed protein product [Closterium sp. Naga37s-1]